MRQSHLQCIDHHLQDLPEQCAFHLQMVKNITLDKQKTRMEIPGNHSIRMLFQFVEFIISFLGKLNIKKHHDTDLTIVKWTSSSKRR